MTAKQTRTSEPGDDAVLLGLLNAVEANETVTQRTLASELGIALGLVNAYLKRCITKGLIKVQDAPARRYAYYLTPQGFSEKSRLTVEYLTHSFSFFRRARRSCSSALAEASGRGWRRVALIGGGELTEVAALCALQSPIEISGIYDPAARGSEQAGLPVSRRIDDLTGSSDGAILTALSDAEHLHADATAAFGDAGVVVPDLLAFAVARRSPDDNQARPLASGDAT